MTAGLNHTPIPWALNPDGTPGYTWNPLTGCLNHNEGWCLGGDFPCYAYRLANGRLRERYSHGGQEAPGIPRDQTALPCDPFYPRLWTERLYGLSFSDKPRGIFVCDMGDFCAPGLPADWPGVIIQQAKLHPTDRFYFLTKQFAELRKLSPFPPNCWVGVTVTRSTNDPKTDMLDPAIKALENIEATILYLSLEPLLEWWWQDGCLDLAGFLAEAGIGWVIIGACTGSLKEMTEVCRRHPELILMQWGSRWTAQPPIMWLRLLALAADQAGIPVFLKDNLYPLIHEETIVADRNKLRVGTSGRLRQEMPQ